MEKRKGVPIDEGRRDKTEQPKTTYVPCAFRSTVLEMYTYIQTTEKAK